MKIEVLDEAEADLAEGFEFYERQSKGLGGYFVESILADIKFLQNYAGFHTLHFGYYRLLAKRFPFGIYYRVEDHVVRVYAVLDARRDPAWIRKRLV